MATAVVQHQHQGGMDRVGGGPLDNDDDARRFLPPPGIHPNSAVFGATNLPKPLTWQRREHLIQRRNILGRIGQLLKRNAQLVVSGRSAAAPVMAPPASTGDSETDDAHAKTWALARKLEVLLFLNSASLLEYSNVDSLARRVQALTASVVNKKIRRQVQATQGGAKPASPPMPMASPTTQQASPPPTTAAGPTSFTAMMQSAMAGVPDAANPYPAAMMMPRVPDALPVPTLPLMGAVGLHSSGGGKRSASEMAAMALDGADPIGMPKRVRTATSGTTNQPAVGVAAKPTRLGHLLFRGFDEMSKNVWSFVDGVEIMRTRGVCRSSRGLAPLFVTSLQMSCNATLRALHTFSMNSGGCILRECINLKNLEVVSLSSGMTFGKLSMRAMNCPQRFVVTHDDHEQIVLALSEQLRSNAFPRLTRLGLTCLFTNEEADGEADVLLNNLMTGCCPQLEELCLPGNSFGDYGAMKVAQMLRSRVCPKLTRLDLRRNFISEEGIRSVCHALADGCAPNLVELCLGGNTITDSCFHHVLFAMESRKIDKLRFLGIEMNYLTATSMEMLGRTIGKLVCPSLSQISYSDNSVENADAKRIIATAVYQERMFRLRQQQLRHQQRVNEKAMQRQQMQQRQQQQPPQQLPHVGGVVAGRPSHGAAAALPHATSFPYSTQDFAPPTTMRGTTTGSSGAYFSEANYSSADGEDDDDDAYSSDGE